MKIYCENHSSRPAVLICKNLNRGFCRLCATSEEMRSGACYYCQYKGKCPIQKFYRQKEVNNVS